MANMTYCRFQNTLADLYDCAKHIDDPSYDTVALDDDIDDYMLSSQETSARDDLINLCVQIALDSGEVKLADSPYK